MNPSPNSDDVDLSAMTPSDTHQSPGTKPRSSPGEGEYDDAPTQVGRFPIFWELARGGMGIVYRAFDPQLNRVVAVKLVQGRFANDVGSKLRFLEESRVTAGLQHPGVPPVYESGELPDGRPYLAMKLIKGQTLSQLLKARDNPFDDLPRFVTYFEAICQTVGYAHANGVIHRDLKPGNIMVGAFGEVQVMDWGLARSAEREELKSQTPLIGGASNFETVAGSIIGTPAFASPEQVRGDVDQIDESSDVFGLGGLLCMILIDRPPFQAADTSTLIEMSRAGDTREAMQLLSSSGADDVLTELCIRCLAANPEARPANGAAVAEEIAAYRANAEARARAAEIERAKAETRIAAERKRRRLLANALGILAVAGSLAVWQWLRAQTAGDLARSEQQKAENANRQTEKALVQVTAEQANTQQALQRETTERQKKAEALDAANAARERTLQALRRVHEKVSDEFFGWRSNGGSRDRSEIAAIAALWKEFVDRSAETPSDRQVILEATIRRAALLRMIGDFVSARQEYEKGVLLLNDLKAQLKSDDFANWQMFANLGLACVSEDERDAGQAVEHYKTAQSAIRELLKSQPDRIDLQTMYVRLLGDHADLYSAGLTGNRWKPSQARPAQEFYQEAQKLHREQLAYLEPILIKPTGKQSADKPLSRIALNIAWMNASSMIRSTWIVIGYPKDAEEILRREVEVRSGFSTRFALSEQQLSAAYLDLSQFYTASNKPNEALTTINEAIKLSRVHRNNSNAKLGEEMQYARLLLDYAQQILKSGGHGQVLNITDEALIILRWVKANGPFSLTNEDVVARVWAARGQALLALQRPQEAVKELGEYRRSLKLAPATNDGDRRLLNAALKNSLRVEVEALGRVRDRVTLIECLNLWEQFRTTQQAEVQEVCRYQAVAIALAQQDKGLVPEERARVIGERIDQIEKCLSPLIRIKKIRLEPILELPEFAILAADPDVAELVRRLKAIPVS